MIKIAIQATLEVGSDDRSGQHTAAEFLGWPCLQRA
jgi:hypothetical protein